MIRFLFPSLFPDPEEITPDPLLRKPRWRPSQLREPSIILVGVLAGVWLVGMITAAFVDLPLSQAVVNPESGWGQFGAGYGEVPGYLLALLSTGLLIRLTRFSGSGVRIGLQIAGTLVVVALHVYGSVRVAEEVSEPYALLIGAGIAAAIPAALILVRRESAELLRPMAFAIVLLAVINPVIIVQLLKTLWGRVRFRNLDPQFSNFTPWFIPQGITGSRSFPSGHAAMGWMLLPVAMLFPLTAYRFRLDAAGSAALGAGTRAASLAIWAVVIVWGVFVAASRVVVGAHYLSDVLFSTGVAFIFSWLLARGLRSREL